MGNYSSSGGHRKLSLYIPEGSVKEEIVDIISRQGAPSFIALKENSNISLYFDTIKDRRAFLVDFEPLLKSFGLSSRPTLSLGRGSERALTIQSIESIGGS